MSGAHGVHEGEPEFIPKSASKTPMIIGVVAAVLLVVVGAVVLGGGSKEEPVKEASSEPKAPPVDPRIARSTGALARIREYQAEFPTDYDELAYRLDRFVEAFPGFPATKDAIALRTDIVDAWRGAVVEARRNLESQVSEHEKNLEFSKALALLETPQEVFEDADQRFSSDNPVFAWTKQKRRDLKTLARAHNTYLELQVKARKYAEDSYGDIALAILDAFPPKYESDALPVWLLKEALVTQIRQEGIASWKKVEDTKGEERERERLAKIEEDRKQRALNWAKKLELAAWENQIGRHNLYNWTVNNTGFGQTPKWRLKVTDGIGVMAGDNSDGGDSYIGIFTNYWQDYVLEFEVRLLDGTLELSPRSSATSGTLSDESASLKFSEETGVRKGKWTKVTVTVNGVNVKAEIPGNEELVLESETSRLLSTGGFVFRLTPGSRAELKNVRTKLVNSTRDGPFGG